MASQTSSTERSPLLVTSHDAPAKPIKTCPRPWLSVILPAFTILGLYSASIVILGTPFSQIAEGIICRNMYDSVIDPVKDPRCKNEDVQAELSLLNAMESLFDLLPCVIYIIPLGVAADIFGRKPVLALNQLSTNIYIALVCVVYWFPHIFPIRLVWFLPLTQFLAGAGSTFLATIFTTVCDVTPEDQRSKIFYYTTAAHGLGSLLASPLTYYLMNVGAWFTVGVALVVRLLANLIACFMAESLPYSQKATTEGADAEDTPTQAHKSIWAQITEPLSSTLTSLHEVFWKNKKLAMLLASSMFATIGIFLVKLILEQYIAKKYHMTWAESNLVVMIKQSVHFGVVLFLLPGLDHWLTKRKVSAFNKDLWIVRVSQLITIAGYLTLGFANALGPFIVGLVGYPFGDGLEPAMRSFSVTVAGSLGTGVLFSVLGFMSSLGVMAAGPIMAVTFRAGLYAGGVWIGLPFFVAAAMIGVSTVMFAAARFEKPEESTSEEEDSQLPVT